MLSEKCFGIANIIGHGRFAVQMIPSFSSICSILFGLQIAYISYPPKPVRNMDEHKKQTIGFLPQTFQFYLPHQTHGCTIVKETLSFYFRERLSFSQLNSRERGRLQNERGAPSKPERCGLEKPYPFPC
ncbi:hypothetical protein CEXT_173701 [Caerostris extrusa]|uniref:Uncharacterized protein n=1 Tax=Caerostris extrusa TaxID=172846 RepID=A0AAV4V185_CAEEX|nr:hypothetical protein CEXT_173701 [Caerostris extrusa]